MMSYAGVGLKVGIEVHRQINTSKKLFCDCPTEPPRQAETIRFKRYLRQAQSELGTIDPAAIFEAKKNRETTYVANLGNVCLVEMDEEPPHPINPEAVDVALTVSLMLGATPVDEIHIMRKIVIDGSNTGGYQRTCIIAVGGSVEVDGRQIPLQTITLEEDAARIVEARRRTVEYDLSRLGVPLVEVSTAPVIESPEEAVKVAKAIGDILRATGKVKRGIGTVRQDLNISIENGALTEIKGIQELDLVGKVVENEARRQLHFIELSTELRRRGIKPDMLQFKPVDVTHILLGSASKLVKRKIDEGGRAMALALTGFAGLLSWEKWPGIRLGAELAARAKAWAEVDGIFHTDELPGYGITAEEVESLREAVGATPEDAAVMVVDEEEAAVEALRAVHERAVEATIGVPAETRAARPDGLTTYMRPRPGAARMYPETDIPPMPVKPQRLEELRRNLPATLEEVAEECVLRYGLSRQLAEALIDEERIQFFKQVVQRYRVPPTVVATTLTETLTSLRREGAQVENLTEDTLEELFKLLADDAFAKEALRSIIDYLARNPEKDVKAAVADLKVSAPPIEELERAVEELIDRNRDILGDRKVFSVLMGDLMKVYRGRVDGGLLSRLVEKKVEEGRLKMRQPHTSGK